MRGRTTSGHLVKFGLYALVVVLANVAGITLFKRFDLTANGIYSLSAASKRAVAALTEPLTLNVFFSRNLPAPYNQTERYLRDLLDEYANYAGRHFNYRFYDVSAEEGDLPEAARDNQQLANNYGIHPVQIQVIEKDEVTFQKAYMGLVMIHGDLIEQIPTITSTDGLEYELTTAIRKLTNKISALLALPDKIRVRLVMSPSLLSVAPYMGLTQLADLPGEIQAAVEAMNRKNYDRLAFEHLSPTESGQLEGLAKKYNLMVLSWPALSGDSIPAGRGTIGLVVEHGKRRTTIPLLQVLRLPLIGTQYKLAGRENVERSINAAIEALIDINEDLGYLADHGTLPLGGQTEGVPGMPRQGGELSNFESLVARNYSLRPVRLGEEDMPEGARCLVIANPRQAFSDYALYQIDQFLMRGNSLALFVDRFEESVPGGQNAQFNPQQIQYTPIDTGLEKLLAHYGVRIETAYLMDESCFRQEVPTRLGGGERPIYFAPLIKDENISKTLAILKSIKALVLLKVSPLALHDDRIDPTSVKVHELLTSSEKAWEMREPINLNPLFIRPPADQDRFGKRPLAYLLEGAFDSYFAGKPLPVREVSDEKAGSEAPPEGSGGDKPAADLAEIERRGEFIAKGGSGKIFLVGSSEILKDNVMDADGRGTNAMFVLNVIDYLSGREEIALMRSKEQRFNPLGETQPATRTLVKTFNVVGLPVLAALCGLAVWVRRAARKKKIEKMFQQ